MATATTTAQAPPPPQNKFKERQVVILLKNDNNKNYYDGEANPFWGGLQGLVLGRVVSAYSDGRVDVKWKNGQRNDYKDTDLTLHSEWKKEQKKLENAPKLKKGVSFESVVMAQNKKDDILSAISQIENTKKIFEEWGFGEVFEKGTAVSLIFYGVPGTGKTLMAQAVSTKIDRPLLFVSPAEIETSTPGGAERNIKKYFAIASGKLPLAEPSEGQEPVLKKYILLFDECDSLIANRDGMGMILRGQVNTLLSELEKFDGVCIFTTNSIKSLDPAMERRITEKIEFEFPNHDQRKAIWRRMIPKKAPLDKSIDFDRLAEVPIAGGNIKNCVLNSVRQAVRLNQKTISYQNFLDAIEKEVKGLKAFEATHQSKYGKVRAYQEVKQDNIEGGVRRTLVKEIPTA